MDWVDCINHKTYSCSLHFMCCSCLTASLPAAASFCSVLFSLFTTPSPQLEHKVRNNILTAWNSENTIRGKICAHVVWHDHRCQTQTYTICAIKDIFDHLNVFIAGKVLWTTFGTYPCFNVKIGMLNVISRGHMPFQPMTWKHWCIFIWCQ